MPAHRESEKAEVTKVHVQLITHVCHCEAVAIGVVGRANYIGILLV